MNIRIPLSSILLAGALSACTVEDDLTKPDVDDTKSEPVGGKTEEWHNGEAPTLFNANLEYDADKLPATGEATKIPWAANYWPIYQDNINHRWNGPSTASPAAKYGQAFGIANLEDAVSAAYGIEYYGAARTACTSDDACDDKLGEVCAKRTGKTEGVCMPTWFGICHAWAPVAILEPEPINPVTYNGVTFKVNDLKALITLLHNRVQNKFVSLRCNEDDQQGEVVYDEYGRPTARECRDTNPGTFHVLMTNYLGKQREAFVYERIIDDEIWNQPLRGYQITESRDITALDANRLLGVSGVGGQSFTDSGTIAKDAYFHRAPIAVTAGQPFKVTMTGTGDADLYLRFGAQPTAQTFDCRPYQDGSDEVCEMAVPAGATQAFVSVGGYAATSNYTLAIVAGGATPTTYKFNARATKLRLVKMTVDYIAESAAETDGNLASNIDRYTHQDHYEYVLEIDAANKIIGGEWVGSSKKHHPDFLWLPTGRVDASILGGKITYANVKMLLDMSIGGGGGGGGGEVKEVNDAATLKKSEWKTYGPFSVAPGKTLTAVTTGSGDVDLYLRKGAAPTLASYDCRPYKNGSAEQCSVVGPGQIYVSVNGYATTSDFSIDIDYTEGGGVTPPNPPPAVITQLDESGTVALDATRAYTLEVRAGQRVVVKTTAPNDVDLYIQMGQAPTLDQFLMRAWTTSGNETITYTPTSNGTLHILVHGFAASSFRLVTTP